MDWIAKHSRQVKKTIDWLEASGFLAAKVEFTGTMGKHYKKQDLWGADVAFRNQWMIGFIQVKSSLGKNNRNIKEGVKQLTDDHWPMAVRRYVIHWPNRAKRPRIWNVKTGEEFSVNSTI